MPRSSSKTRMLLALLSGMVIALGCAWTFSGSILRRNTRWQYRVLSAAQMMGLTQAPGVGPLLDNASGTGGIPAAMQDVMEKSVNGELQMSSENTLNRLGAEGYELSAVSDGWYIFKRPIR